MFFVVPHSHALGSSRNDSSSRSPPPTLRNDENHNPAASYYPKRTPKACDRCRLKKARCSSGRGPCTKCKRDGVVCVTSTPTRSDAKLQNPEYVQMVEGQRDLLVQALHKIWKASHGNDPNAEYELQAILRDIGTDRTQATESRRTQAPERTFNDEPAYGNVDEYDQMQSAEAHRSGQTGSMCDISPMPTKGGFALPSIDRDIAMDQLDETAPKFDQAEFENWCPEWLQSSLEAMPAFNESLDPATMQSMAQSPRLTWESWVDFCDQAAKT